METNTTKVSKKTKRFWTKKQCDKMVSIIEDAPSKTEGVKEAASYFGVTASSVSNRYTRYKRKEHDKFLSRKMSTPATVPAVKAKRTYTKKSVTDKMVTKGSTLAIDIRDIKFDFKNKKILIEY
jgi:hypothetical protein